MSAEYAAPGLSPALLVLMLVIFSGSIPVAAEEELSVESIVEGLKTRGSSVKTRGIRTRGLASDAPQSRNPDEEAGETTHRLRSIMGRLRAPALGAPVVTTSKQEREQIQSIVEHEALPAIDIEIYFDTASTQIRPQSLPDLTKLGLALRNDAFVGADFLIIGHTDARGGDSYNLELSQGRAQSVRNFLAETFGLEAQRLIAIGYGEERLKFPDAPNADQNRRVEVINATQ